MARRARGVDGELLEGPFQAQVLGLAHFYGWRTYHPPDNKPDSGRAGRAGKQRVTPGYPDLTMVRGPELLFVELKRDRGRISPAQEGWLDALREVAEAVAEWTPDLERSPAAALANPPMVEVHVWRPADWDEIQDRLSLGRERLDPIGAI